MKCKIIAELGYNFIGDISIAESMIREAKLSGADFVKIQIWFTKNLKNGPWDEDGRREIYQQAELDSEKILKIMDLCKKYDIQFLTSVFNRNDIKNLPKSYAEIIKIPSTEIMNTNLLKICRDRFKKIIISTGASTIKEIESAYNICKPCCLMHCTSVYPCPPELANLRKINTLKKISPEVGFSDHTIGIEAACFAFSHDCSYLEKHFTTDQTLPGRDNRFSATEDVLKTISRIRDKMHSMTKKVRLNYYDQEKDMRTIYRGRWEKNV